MTKKMRLTGLLMVLALVAVGAWRSERIRTYPPLPKRPETVAELREMWNQAARGDTRAAAVLGWPFWLWEGRKSKSAYESSGARERRIDSLEKRLQGSPSMKIVSARRYRTGAGGEQDLGKAKRLLLEAVEAGYPQAFKDLGELYYFGEGVTQSYEEAARLFEEGARRGAVQAMIWTGDVYRDGLGVEASDEEALRWYREAARIGFPEAYFRLGQMYAEGRGVEADMEQALHWLLRAADWDVEDAQFMVSKLYAEGWEGVAASPEESLAWLQRAVALGHEEALATLIALYLKGKVPPRGLEEPSMWSGDLLELDDGAFLNNVASLGVFGEDFSTITLYSERQYQKAVALGDARARLNFGVLNACGLLEGSSDLEAVRLFRNAAAQGLPEAMNELGNSYATGRGVLLDFAEAARWYRKAATADDADAQFNLGLLYVWGGGVEQDYRQAYEWLEQAASDGDPVAVAMRDRVGELLEAESSVQTAS